MVHAGWRARLATVLAVMLPGPALAVAPLTLACTADNSLNWRAAAPTAENPFGPKPDGLVVHVDPESGKWFLENPKSAALASDGGDFSIQRRGLEKPFDEWIGTDGDTMLRIFGNLDANRFMLVARGRDLLLGTCLVPADPFLFLGETNLQ